MNPSDHCPQCGSVCYKRNGRIHTGKQNHRCKDCGRQFVLSAENRLISDADRALVKRLLTERLSLRGICRAVRVSLRWLVDFVVDCYAAAPDDLNVRLPEQPDRIIVQRLAVEADEAWRFVSKKANPQWLWLALDAQTRQVVAFQVGDRSRKSARKRWKKIPPIYRDQATFYTDGHVSYQGVIPSAQHQVITKKARKTNPVERLNCTLRQRVSRLVRATLSFSKKLDNHVGAIKYFLCHYNLEVGSALPV
jgi:insertion element IS1 protein InsB